MLGQEGRRQDLDQKLELEMEMRCLASLANLVWTRAGRTLCAVNDCTRSLIVGLPTRREISINFNLIIQLGRKDVRFFILF